MTHHTSEGIVPWPADQAALFRSRGYWRDGALGSYVLDAADRTPDAVALVDGEMRLTYAELVSRMDGCAERMFALGLRADDRLLLQLPNCWEFVVLTLACFRAGVVPVMALTAHRQYELAHLAQHSEAAAIVVQDVFREFDHLAMAHALAEQVPTLRHVVVKGDAGTAGVSLERLVAPSDDAAGARDRLNANAPHGDAVACFLLSGGTTGLPKLIARTHNDYELNVRMTSAATNVTDKTVYLGTLPASHNFPFACPGILGALFAGGRVVMLPSPEPRRAFFVIHAEKVTLAAAVPAVAQRWIEYQKDNQTNLLDSLEVLQVGGARLADELAYKVRPVLGATLQQVFGMAEGLINMTRLDDPEEVICETQGRPVSEADEIRIVDQDGNDLPVGTPGSMLTRGPYTPRGYYRAEEQNALAFTPDGWYSSGDIVEMRADGNLIVQGRDKDMINRGGEKISAEEIENLAYRVDGVALAAAVGIPDQSLGERLCLCVTLTPGASVSLEEIQQSMRELGVAPFKIPERLVILDELPTTKVGKIDKKALRENLAR
jgi:2-hydroxy-7-methoxy-5-methyl-1-naphthoate---CoA ligase